MEERIKEIIAADLEVKKELLADEAQISTIQAIVRQVVQTFRAGNKVLFCGNGGSAADAQHLAAELSGRFYLDRKPLFAEALHVNSSFLTAVANDFGFEEVFARAVGAMGREGDLLVALSTSGNSPNVLRAIETAKSMGLQTVGMTGRKGGAMAENCDYLIKIPSDDTPRIQEGHILVGHVICELAEQALFR